MCCYGLNLRPPKAGMTMRQDLGSKQRPGGESKLSSWSDGKRALMVVQKRVIEGLLVRDAKQ